MEIVFFNDFLMVNMTVEILFGYLEVK